MRAITHGALVLAGSLVANVSLLTGGSLGDPWPQRAVRLITPTTAGSGLDFTARLFAERLAERWGKPVIVDNRPGADGIVAVSSFVGARDDHVLLFSFAGPISVNPLVHKKLPYDPVGDLVPIASATDVFLTIAASQSLEVKSLAELVNLARSQPGKLNWSAGPGALPLVFAGFLKSAGLDMSQIFYRDLAQAVQDLARGRIHVLITTITAVASQVQAGKVQLLAVTNRVRAPTAPNIQTVLEAGYPEVTLEGLQGFFGLRGISTELRDHISNDIRATAADPALAKRLAVVGQIARGSTAFEFAAAIEEQRAKIAAMVQLIGTRPASER
jgi:tripartite-type tricarboxylate transporter receptor subunit TctC